MVVASDIELGFNSGEGAREAATTSKMAGGTKITQSQHVEVVTRKNGTRS